MSTITVYMFEDAEGAPDCYSTLNADEAKKRGQRYNMRVVAHEFEWADSETAWDFTDNGPSAAYPARA